jgi:hypothetical protein
MSQKVTSEFPVLAWLALGLATTPLAALSQGTAFTYQGQLDNNGAPASRRLVNSLNQKLNGGEK